MIQTDVQTQAQNQELRTQKQILQAQLESLNEQLKERTDRVQDAFLQYCESLDTQYDQREIRYDSAMQSLEDSYNQYQQHLEEQKVECQAELDKIRATRAALIKAQIKEKEIQDNKEFYTLPISENDKDDYYRLNRIKKDLHNPRILSMLIWQTYFQKAMTALCNNVLGTKEVTGIYKITNLNDQKCYIGQATSISDRWKEHAKCGLGIDTPSGNKLYAAIQEEGIWNFSWELLEACPREQLNEKEKYYIGIYDSYNYGYNSNAGIGKK